MTTSADSFQTPIAMQLWGKEGGVLAAGVGCTEENSLGCGEKTPGQCGTLPPVIARGKSHRQVTHHKIPCEPASQKGALIPRKEKSLLPGNSGRRESERRLWSLSVVVGCSHGPFPEWTAALNQQRRQKDQE